MFENYTAAPVEGSVRIKIFILAGQAMLTAMQSQETAIGKIGQDFYIVYVHQHHPVNLNVGPDPLADADRLRDYLQDKVRVNFLLSLQVRLC